VPPTDFDAPYSKMPPSVEKLMPRVKKKVKESYSTKDKEKEEKKLLEQKRKDTMSKTKKNKDLED
jgi:hypothetical protein